MSADIHNTTLTPTLTSADYCSDEIFELERRRIFHSGWFVAARADTLARGNRRVIDVAGESVLLTRDLSGTIHAFANVCRHRGARLCDGDSDSTQGSLMCPYHAWTYALDGRLIATPHLEADEFDRDALSLWSVACEVRFGFVFVCIAQEPPVFEEWMKVHGDQITDLERFDIGALKVAVTTTAEVAANWKIILENYQECLHCTRVHPELVEVIPLYRTGWVWDHQRTDGGASLSNGGHSLCAGAESQLPLLPGLSDTDATSYFGGTVFPNMLIDTSGTCVIASTLYPKGPAHTTVVAEYMFAAETIAQPGFDPSAVIDFNEMVAKQDNEICERVQRGVSSRLFQRGVLSSKDDQVVSMNKHYLQARGPVDSG